MQYCRVCHAMSPTTLILLWLCSTFVFEFQHVNVIIATPTSNPTDIHDLLPQYGFPTKGSPPKQRSLLHPPFLRWWVLHRPTAIPMLRPLLRPVSLLPLPHHRIPLLRFRFRRLRHPGQDALPMAPRHRNHGPPRFRHAGVLRRSSVPEYTRNPVPTRAWVFPQGL